MSAMVRQYRIQTFVWSVLTLWLALTAGAQGLQTPSILDTAGDPNLLAVADLNRDGKADLIYQDAVVGGNLHILLGNGDGSFRAGQVIAIGTGVGGAIDLGDLNGDGTPDIVLGGSAARITVLLGKGDGSFAAAVVSPTPYLPATGIYYHLAVADFDGDGHADLVYSDSSGGERLMRGDGTGRLTDAATFPGASGDIVSADLNGDGRPDLMVAGYVSLNQGGGVFSPFIAYATSSFSQVQKSFGLIDVDGDGHLDIVNGGSQGGTAQVMVALGHADGTFSTPVALSTTSVSGFSVAGFADLGGDGRPRAFLATTEGVSTALGASPPNHPLYATTGYRYAQAVVADFNGDGYADFAVPGDRAIVLVFGKPDGSFAAAPSILTGDNVGGLVFADTNQDGRLDAILGGYRVLLGNGDGSFANTPVQNYAGAGNAIYLGNFNGDSKTDLFNYQSVFLGNGDGTFTSQYLTALALGNPPIGEFPNLSAAVADLNGDGLDDVAASFSREGTGVGGPVSEQVALALSGPGKTYAYSYLPLAERAGPIGIGDFDGDGCKDLAVAGTSHIFLYKGDCSGRFSAALTYPTGVAASDLNAIYANFEGTSAPADLAVSDLDRDGHLDLIYTIPSLNEAMILYGNGDGTFTAGTPLPLAHSNLFVTVADLDQDGYPDLIFSGHSIASVVFGASGRTFAPEKFLAAGAETGKATVGDVDNNGKLDIGFPNLGIETSRLLEGGVTFSLFVNSAPSASASGTSGSLTIAPEPTIYGDSAQGTAIFAALNNTAVPTGFVSIRVDGTASGTAALDAKGHAAFPLGGLDAGIHTISVTYQGDINFRTAVASATHTVSPAVPSMSVVSSASSSITTQAVSFTSKVTSSAGIPSGVVQFYDNGALLGTVPLDTTGTTIFSVSALSAGSHLITALFPANGNYAAASASLTQIVSLAPTALSLAVAPPSTSFGAEVTISALVQPVSSASTGPTGTVACTSGTLNLGSAPLVGASAQLPSASLPTGVNNITCTYSGDAVFAPSSAGSTVTVTGPSPSINFNVADHTFGDVPFAVLATSNSPGALSYSVISGPAALAGNTVSLSGAGAVVLQVTQTAAGNFGAGSQQATFVVGRAQQTITFAPPASITYGSGAVALAATASSGLAVQFSILSGPAILTGNLLTATGSGAVTIAANQPGNSNYLASSQTTQSVTVTVAPVHLVWAPSPLVYGNPLMSAQNASATSGNAAVAGSFQYLSGPNVLLGSTLLPAGSYSLTVTFTPADTDRYASATATASLLINKATPAVTVAASAGSVFLQSSLQFTASVSSSAGVPSGSVSFLDGATVLGTAALNGGIATLSVPLSTNGTHTITAAYSGDANFASAGSVSLTEIVQDLSVGTSNLSQTVSNGGLATFNFAVSSTNGSNLPGSLQLSVSGLPPGATGTFSPQTLPAGSAGGNVSLTIQLPKQALLVPAFTGKRISAMIFAWFLFPVLLRGRDRSSRFRRGLLSGRFIVIVALLSCSTCVLGGCGASNSSGKSLTQSYPLTVTFTSGGLVRSTVVTLNVE